MKRVIMFFSLVALAIISFAQSKEYIQSSGECRLAFNEFILNPADNQPIVMPSNIEEATYISEVSNADFTAELALMYELGGYQKFTATSVVSTIAALQQAGRLTTSAANLFLVGLPNKKVTLVVVVKNNGRWIYNCVSPFGFAYMKAGTKRWYTSLSN